MRLSSRALVLTCVLWVCSVASGEGRQLGVRVSEPMDQESQWKYFPWGQQPPATPVQSTVLLTPADRLTIAVPMFAYRPELALFDTKYTRNGRQLELEGFTLLTGAVTMTMYGPGEFLKQIGSLPGGDYTLTVRNYATLDVTGSLDFAAFQADPKAYAASRGIFLNDNQQTLSFTVVPEPGMAALLGLSVLLLKRRR